jgi:hypothetical protein
MMPYLVLDDVRTIDFGEELTIGDEIVIAVWINRASNRVYVLPWRWWSRALVWFVRDVMR